MIFFKALLLLVGFLAVYGPVLVLMGRLADIIANRLPLNDKWEARLSTGLLWLLGWSPILYLAEYGQEWAIFQDIFQDIVAWLYR
ncbi:hypothetical protein FZCC0069_01265 [Rhodobacterales bacterium FZCC0069]|nr:hypothetical protein [Rhodobacterales bacterium FZCC0069]